ncbi:hypothetical protein F5Y07DRAFT_404411 [Xylaria sp. FL0933]|nr:hypothetical protein F5Y07DRAFT_404411 [Xylaria sp. FL0933]
MHSAIKAKTVARHNEPYNQRFVDAQAQVFTGLALHDEAPVQDSINNALTELEPRRYQTRREMRKRDPRPISQTPKTTQQVQAQAIRQWQVRGRRRRETEATMPEEGRHFRPSQDL